MGINSEENLQEAFAEEAKAFQRYTFFAEKAEADGHVKIARLFRAAAEAEAIHARNHFNAMGGAGSVKENLMAASIAEHKEFTGMYPGFIKKADEERNGAALRTFKWANAVERIHHGYFEEALSDVKNDRQPADKVYFVCLVCGNTVTDEIPGKCQICGAARGRFKTIK
jgi:rubrerythrin